MNATRSSGSIAAIGTARGLPRCDPLPLPGGLDRQLEARVKLEPNAPSVAQLPHVGQDLSDLHPAAAPAAAGADPGHDVALPDRDDLLRRVLEVFPRLLPLTDPAQIALVPVEGPGVHQRDGVVDLDLGVEQPQDGARIARVVGLKAAPHQLHALLGARHSSSSSTDRNASWGTSTRPTCFMRFLPFFCFSSSLRLRVTSPP